DGFFRAIVMLPDGFVKIRALSVAERGRGRANIDLFLWSSEGPGHTNWLSVAADGPNRQRRDRETNSLANHLVSVTFRTSFTRRFWVITCLDPDGQSISTRSTFSASPKPKYRGSELCDRYPDLPSWYFVRVRPPEVTRTV